MCSKSKYSVAAWHSNVAASDETGFSLKLCNHAASASRYAFRSNKGVPFAIEAHGVVRIRFVTSRIGFSVHENAVEVLKEIMREAGPRYQLPTEPFHCATITDKLANFAH